MWNLMGYDFSGSWSDKAMHQANVYPNSETYASVDDAVKFFLSNGATPSKMVIGMPLYAHSFAHTKGLGHRYRGAPDGALEGDKFWYHDLPLPHHEEHFDAKLIACWSKGSRNGGEIATYENAESAKAKVDYIQSKQLGGAMWWELAGDFHKGSPNHGRALIPKTGDHVRDAMILSSASVIPRL